MPKKLRSSCDIGVRVMFDENIRPCQGGELTTKRCSRGSKVDPNSNKLICGALAPNGGIVAITVVVVVHVGLCVLLGQGTTHQGAG